MGIVAGIFGVIFCGLFIGRSATEDWDVVADFRYFQDSRRFNDLMASDSIAKLTAAILKYKNDGNQKNNNFWLEPVIFDVDGIHDVRVGNDGTIGSISLENGKTFDRPTRQVFLADVICVTVFYLSLAFVLPWGATVLVLWGLAGFAKTA